MNTDRRSYIILGIVVVMLTLLFAWLFSRATDQQNWRRHLQPASEDPYGTLVIHELLRGYHADYAYIELDEPFDSIPQSSETAGYVFIGNSFRPDSLTTQALVSFIARGNTALISAEHIHANFFERLLPEYCEELPWPGIDSELDSVAHFRLTDEKLWSRDAWEVQFRTGNIYYVYAWPYLADDIFCEAPLRREDLGYINDSRVHFLRVAYGNGYLLLHTAPLLFTNYYLLEEPGLAYANGVFSYLPEGDLYGDYYSFVNARGLANETDFPGARRTFADEGPLSYILSNRELSWAWYLLLAGGLLFLFFRAKRRQRVIPVLEPNRNTSLEFITNIGRLYFLRPNHRKLALEQMQLFLQFVRERYHLHGREPDEPFVKTLAVRSGISKEYIDDIVAFHRRIESSAGLSEVSLGEFHRKLEYFYHHCK